jgi:hypothetical protein
MTDTAFPHAYQGAVAGPLWQRSTAATEIVWYPSVKSNHTWKRGARQPGT